MLLWGQATQNIAREMSVLQRVVPEEAGEAGDRDEGARG